VTIPGMPRAARPQGVRDEVRDKYRNADRTCGPQDVGKYPAVCTFSSLTKNEDGTNGLFLVFGLDTATGPKSWKFSVNVDKAPSIFWETVESMIGQYEGNVSGEMFQGKTGLVIVAGGKGKYVDDYRIRRVERLAIGSHAPQQPQYQQPTQGPPQGYQQGPPPQYQQGPPQGYQQGQPQYQQGPPQGYQQGPPPQYQNLRQQGPPQGYQQAQPPGQTYGGSAAEAMGVPDSDLPF
jgi:hypothetical protein